MHEGTLVREMVKKVNEIAAAEEHSRIVSVTVLVGDFSHCSAEHLREHFELESAGTACEGAELRTTAVSGLDNPMSLEIVLESIELDLPEAVPHGHS